MWCGDLPTSSFSTLARTLATSYVKEPLLDTIILKGYQFYGFWVTTKTWGVQLVGYIVLNVPSLKPVSLLIILSIVMSFAFSLLVGSLFRIL